MWPSLLTSRRSARRALLALTCVLALVPLAASPLQAAFPGANGRIAFGSTRAGSFDVYSMEPDGTDVQRLTTTGGLLPSWSADASRIAFQSTRDGNLEIYVMDADGSNQTRLTSNSVFEEDAAFAPDGTKIAFTSARDDASGEIYVMDADGSNVVRLTSSSGVDRDPVFSPDGTKIAFSSSRDGGPGEIYVMSADGSDPTRLTTTAGTDFEPDWSPDGTRIVYAGVESGVTTSSGIFTIDADGSNRQLLVDTAGGDEGPVFSPDGQKVAFSSSAVGDTDVLTVDAADGGNATNLTNLALIDKFPDWAPSTSTPTGFTLAVSKAGTGSGSVSSSPAGIDCGTTCSADFADGTEVTLSASADAGSSFDGWSGDCSGAESCVVTMSEARSVTATFTSSGGGGGDPSWVVNTTDDADDGACTTTHCSLREALTRANAEAGADTIGFDIAGPSPHSIQLATGLPAITEAVTIDAATQPGYSSSPVVEVDGSTIRCGPFNSRTQCGQVGFAIDQSSGFGSTTIRGFAISGFAVGAVKVCVGDCDLVPYPGGHGIYVNGGSGNVIEGNHIGTDVTGTQAKPNQGAGIKILGGSSRIGGPSPGQGNIVGANGTAPYLEGGIVLGSVQGNVIEGNAIGTGAAGTEALGNIGAGVLVASAVEVFSNSVGGTAPGAANTIANNTVGVVVAGPGPKRTSILTNEIFGNDELGIDLENDGVTANDPGDADTGANDHLNYPTLSTAASGNGGTRVEGSLDSADGTYRVELFSSAACDASGHGEGETFLGFETVTVSGGPEAFVATLPVEVAPGTHVTATATDSAGNTSEFSACEQVEEAPPADISIAKADDADPVSAGSQLTYTLTVDNAGPGDAHDVVVTDTLPDGVSFVSASDGGTEAAGIVTWELGSIAPSDPEQELTLVVAVDPEQTDDLSNTASVSTSSPDPQTGDNTAVETTAVTGPGDVVYPPHDPPLPPEPGTWSWGYGYLGGLGSGSSNSRHVPGAVRDVGQAEQLAAGSLFGLALQADGTVESWGQNYAGQLGADPSTTSCNPYGESYAYTYLLPCRTTSAPVAGLTNVDSISAQGAHALALRADGSVHAWGQNSYGQLGVDSADTSCSYTITSGTTTNTYTNICRPQPEAVPGLSRIVAVSAGSWHNLALDADGKVWSWGYNGTGELGVDPSTTSCTVTYAYGTTTYEYTYSCRPEPELVPGLSGIVAIAAGSSFSLALDADGHVWSWGYNGYGQLGVEPTETTCEREYTDSGYTWTQTYSCRPAPARIDGLTGVTKIAAGSAHALALQGGDVYGWGYNYGGALGVEPPETACTATYGYAAGGSAYSWEYTSTCRGAPGLVPGLSGIVEIAGGGNHGLARDGSGEVYAWGSNWNGELGAEPGHTTCTVAYYWYSSTPSTYTSTGCRAAPEPVAGLSGAGAIAGGYGTSYAAATASPNLGVDSFTTTVAAGTTVSSDVDRDGATADDPVEVSVTSPNAGEISVAKTSERSWVGDFVVYGRTVEIDAPDASSADDPIVLTFVVDQSVYPTTWDVAWLYVYRNGSWVPDCTGAGAAPDPCVASRTRLPDGDVEVVVRTTKASSWTIGVTGPTAEAGGPYAADEGSTVQLDATDSTGTQTPLRYAWNQTAALDDVASATPSLEAVDDGTQLIDLTVIDALGLTDTDVAEVVIENVAPTATFQNTGPVQAGQTFQLTLTSPQDPSPVDTAAGFEYAFDCGDGSGYGAWGTASTRTCPTSAAGTRSVKGRIRDKDGGVTQYTATVTVNAPSSPCAGPPPVGAIVRGPGNDKITGTAGDDVIYDAGGTNTINGAGGNDVICTGSGADTIDGGLGNDVVVDSGGKNTVKGGGGDDRITTGAGDDSIDGGPGDDTIVAGAGNDTIVGAAGNDTISAGLGNDKITGGDGNDAIDAGDGNNDVSAGAGDDTIDAGSGNDKIDGGSGFDTCRPGGGTNTVRGCEA